MSQNLAVLALDGGDPRRGSLQKLEEKSALVQENNADETSAGAFNIDAALIHNDPSVLFEEYLHYAKITRDAESHYETGMLQQQGRFNLIGVIKNRFSKGHVHQTAANGDITTEIKKHQDYSTVTEDEWRVASRATRTASWGTIFFLITTDILGPTGAPWAFANTGYGPGVALYTTFGFLASVSGWYVWRVYMFLDSDRYPLRDFGQAFFRVYNQPVRHLINILQSLQMFMLVAVLVLGLGGSVSQVSIGKDGAHGNGLCYIVCMVIIAILGMVLGQIRTLQRFGWLANFSVWTTVITSIMAVAVSANSSPNYATMFGSYAGGGTPGIPYGDTNFPTHNVSEPIPVRTFAGSPPNGFASGGTGFLGTYQGINIIIYAYGGAMLFFNLMAEMRNPWDFWKGMIAADVFIYLVYMFFGIFQYSQQGQYTFITAIQSINPYNYQTAGNILSIIGGLIAAALYGNIGIKVIYNNVFVEILHFPPLTQKSGKLIWVVMVPMYWGLAFIVAGAVPQLGDITSLVGAFCIGNFTYSFPALLKIGFDIKRGAMLPEEKFDEATKKYVRLDGGMKRWIRGYKKTFFLTTLNVIYFLGALVVCGMGCYSAIKALIGAFAGGSVATSFTCRSPYAG